MPIAKAHPCNGFGWLHIEAADAQYAMAEQMRLRDAELAKDRHASGEPAGFYAWSCEQIRRLARQPNVAKQLRERMQVLQGQLGTAEAEYSRAAARFAAETDRINSDLALLQDLLAAAD